MPDNDPPLTDQLPAVVAAPDEQARYDNALGPLDALEARDLHLDDPDDTWASGPVKPGIRLRMPTAILLVLIAVAGGFWGGAVAEKHHSGSSSAASSLASRFAALRGSGASAFGGAGGASGIGGGGFGGSATEGLVTGIKGQTLYITTSSLNLVPITLGPTATVTETLSGGLSDLKVGQTVTVRGTANADGSIVASSIAVTPSTGASSGSSAGGTGAGTSGG